MKTRLVIISIVLVVFVVIGLVVSAWLGRPKLVQIYPAPGSVNLPATSPVRLEFSRPMQAEGVIEHLKLEPDVEGKFSWEGNTLTFIPNSVWPDGQEIKLVLEPGAKASSWLAFPMKGQNWSFTIGVAYLAYLWPSEGPANLYALNPETGEIRQITREMEVLEFTPSRDGRLIYFSASNAQGGADLYQVDRMKEPTSSYEAKPQELLSCGENQCRSPAVSEDGKYLAYEYLEATVEGESLPTQIWLLNLSSLTTSQMAQAGHETVQPSWSPSGWLAYYDRSSKMYEAINILTQAKVTFSNQTGQPGQWSRDGNFYLAPEIYYQQTNGSHETGTSHLLLYSLKDGSTIDISKTEGVEDVEGIYSPDGRSIAFARKYLDEAHWTLGRQIWLMNADGSNPHALTSAADYNHYDLAWSQDGMKIAFVRFNQAKLSDPPELWMMNADGSNLLELVVGGYSPAWIP